jgi:hypothetical protein
MSILSDITLDSLSSHFFFLNLLTNFNNKLLLGSVVKIKTVTSIYIWQNRIVEIWRNKM